MDEEEEKRRKASIEAEKETIKRAHSINSEIYKRLDSLFRFYGAEITAHATLLIAIATASAVFGYQALSRWFGSSQFTGGVYDIFLVGVGFVLILLLLYFVGKLFYYTHLSNISQIFMGMTYDSKKQLDAYQDLLDTILVEHNSLGYKVTDVLFYRIKHRLLKHDTKLKPDEKAFDKITEVDSVGWLTSNFIMLSNLRIGIYRELFCRILRNYGITLYKELWDYGITFCNRWIRMFTPPS